MLDKDLLESESEGFILGEFGAMSLAFVDFHDDGSASTGSIAGEDLTLSEDMKEGFGMIDAAFAEAFPRISLQ